MPSPVGHSLIGIALGLAWRLPRVRGRDLLRTVWEERVALVAALALANLPDVDYLPGIAVGEINRFHHTWTHTLGFVAATSALAWLVWRARERSAAALLWFFAFGASHLAADLVTEDRSAPYGIMVLWPFSSEYWISPWPLFWHLRKREWGDFLQTHNAQAVLVEAAWCLPLVLLVLAWKTRAARSETHRASRNEPRASL